MKLRKKVLIVLLILVTILFWGKVINEVSNGIKTMTRQTMTKEDIFDFVKLNKDKIEKVANEIYKEEMEYVKKREKKLIKKIDEEMKIRDLFIAENSDGIKHINFSCEYVDNGKYGFYFSINDIPIFVEGGKNDMLIETEKGNLFENGSYRYYTERITENYFYYEKIYK